MEIFSDEEFKSQNLQNQLDIRNKRNAQKRKEFSVLIESGGVEMP